MAVKFSELIKRKRFWFTSVAIVILAVLIVLLVGFYKRLKEPVFPAYNALPSNAAVIMEFGNEKETIYELQNNSTVWNAIAGLPAIHELHSSMSFLDSLTESDQELKALMKEQKLLVSIHPFGYERLEFLFLHTLPNPRKQKEIKVLFEKYIENAGFSESEKHGYTVYEIKRTGEKTFYFSVARGLFVGSFYPLLLENSLEKIRNENQEVSSCLIELLNTKGKNVDANIFVNYSYFARIPAPYFDESFRTDIAFLESFGSWSGFDVLIKKDAFVLNGYSTLSDSTTSFLSAFSGQETPELKFPAIIPNNTAFFVAYGFQDMDKFYADYSELLGKAEIEKNLQAFKKKCGKDIRKGFEQWGGKEMVLLYAKPGSRNHRESSYFMIQTSDISAASDFFSEASIQSLKNSSGLAETTYRGYKLLRLDVDAWIPSVMGSLFQGIEKTWFTCVEDFVVFANSPPAIEDFLNSFLSGKGLSENPNYQKLSDQFSDRANLFAYINIRNSLPVIEKYLVSEQIQKLDSNLGIWKNFEAFAIQYAVKGDKFYSHAVLQYNPDYLEESPSFWETTLDTTIAAGPFRVFDHSDKSHKTIVFDDENYMYFIDSYGDIVWKLAVTEPINSDLFEVDRYMNSKVQYVFSTTRYIYMVDVKGRIVDGFPVKIQADASAGMNVLDYDNNKNYRFVIPGRDKKIYNYSAEGSKVAGWTEPQTDGIVNMPVQHFRIGGKDYLMVSQHDGKTRILNRKGEIRIRLQPGWEKAANSKYYVNGSNFMTTSAEGKVINFSENGQFTILVEEKASANHHFFYYDMNADGILDFIFIDQNKLWVRTLDSILFEYEFETSVNSEPAFFKSSGGKALIALADEKSKQVMFFDKNGVLPVSQLVSGNTSVVSFPSNKGGSNIMVGLGAVLYNYNVDFEN